ncbi:hypothetical protein B4099_3671 [Heyndrickxia coagulans]|uniref:Uncharacterized protein n=1 Tax=Heyndrickxia coagulans TaxID=1398 RepID=A0A150KI47_HEYCO|nr:hypothetical protein B4099_3671 [Heyndrickxia coagulans]
MLEQLFLYLERFSFHALYIHNLDGSIQMVNLKICDVLNLAVFFSVFLESFLKQVPRLYPEK